MPRVPSTSSACPSLVLTSLSRRPLGLGLALPAGADMLERALVTPPAAPGCAEVEPDFVLRRRMFAYLPLLALRLLPSRWVAVRRTAPATGLGV
jgi:hypothetical protein